MRAALAAAAALRCASGHFSVQSPATWHDGNGTAFKPGSQCVAGCAYLSNNCYPNKNYTSHPPCYGPNAWEGTKGCACEWYTNWTFIPGKPTIADDSPLRTYKKKVDYPTPAGGAPADLPTHPWRAPGTAPTFSPCGVDGGNRDGCPVGAPIECMGTHCRCAPGGYGHGPDGRTLPGNTNPPKWVAGSAAEVIWAITANHGGGYSMRLCKKPAPENMMTNLTEDCFQKGALRFSGDKQWIQTGPDVSTRSKAFPAMRTTTGTFPAGSQWTRNPIPACNDSANGGAPPWSTCSGAQFAPPLPDTQFAPAPAQGGYFGFGQGGKGQRSFDFSIVDKVAVPADLDPGLYVLSVRFDCEQTPQVWNSCSDVVITK